MKRVVPPGPVKDALRGTWLGHPVHPMLTDIPIGSFSSAAVLDVLGGRRGQPAADLLIALGLLAAVPTAAAGAADWSDTYGSEQRVDLLHAVSNALGPALYAASFVARQRGLRGRGKLLGFAGMASMTAGGYLGGYLSYTRGVGVNYAFNEHPPDEWTAVLDAAELSEGKPVAAHANGANILLYRAGERIYAIARRCSHAGGPSDEGDVDEASCTVRCPWHQSVFRLDDGSVARGPAATPKQAYDVRITAGRIEVRARRQNGWFLSRVLRPHIFIGAPRITSPRIAAHRRGLARGHGGSDVHGEPV